MKKPPPNYDYTSAKRVAKARALAAARLDVTLDTQHAAALQWIVDDTDQPPTAIVRRLILEEASRRGAPLELDGVGND